MLVQVPGKHCLLKYGPSGVKFLTQAKELHILYLQGAENAECDIYNSHLPPNYGLFL